MVDVEDAAALAETKLAQALPRRWRHVRSVARRARWVAKTLGLPDDLVAAAWLHDIGYAPELVDTGFHPLDGARYLRRAGMDGQVVCLVAYHSCAQIEAEVRGLSAELAAEFSPPDSPLADALRRASLSTGAVVRGPIAFTSARTRSQGNDSARIRVVSTDTAWKAALESQSRLEQGCGMLSHRSVRSPSSLTSG